MASNQDVPSVVVIMDSGSVRYIDSNVEGLKVAVVDFNTNSKDSEKIFADPHGDKVAIYRPKVEPMSDFARDILFPVKN